jgi:signal transduction histidine kinase
MEYISGDDIEKEKIFQSLKSIQEKLLFLASFEESKLKTTQSKFRDNKKIYTQYTNLLTQYHNLSKLIEEQLENRYKAGSSFDNIVDEQYYSFLNQVTQLEQYLDETFHKVNNEFTNMKNNIYIIIFILCFFGLLISYIVLRSEITKVKKIKEKEEAIKIQSNNKLEAISTMLSNIAHQWRQPLNATSVSTSSLLLKTTMNDDVNKEELTKQLDFVVNKTQYLSNIINDFKAFHSTDELLILKEFDTKQSIEETILSLEDIISKENITIITKLDEITINNNETQFRQVFLNILNNSIEALHTKTDKFIFINTLIDENNQFEIIIKDSADGIKENSIDNIYEPYFTTKHQSQGTGLGLYFVYEIITKYFHGSIQSKNIIFTYNDQELRGLQTTIKLNCT